MSWSEEGFRERVARRCEELRRSKRSVLKAAGLAHDYLQTEPAHGRRVDNLEKLAVALDWSLAEIVGVRAITLNEQTLLRAYSSMQRVARVTDRRTDQDRVWILSVIYNLFEDAREQYADANSGFEEYATYIEKRVALMLTDPDFVASVEKKIQRFQLTPPVTVVTTVELKPSTGLSNRSDPPIPSKS